jgi:hypothetical protein
MHLARELNARRARDAFDKNEETNAMQIEHSECAQGHLVRQRTAWNEWPNEAVHGNWSE